MRFTVPWPGMASVYTIPNDKPSWPLELVVDSFGSGGIGGLTPTVAIRNAATTDSYLDWNDFTFKTSGWALKDAPMTEIVAGIYQRQLPVAALGLDSGETLAAEYTTTGPGVAGVDVDTILLSDEAEQVALVRKMHTNRCDVVGGAPGTMTYFDDDNATPLGSQTLRDVNGGPVADTPGSPARRGKLT